VGNKCVFKTENFVKIPEFKPSSHFVHGIELVCLVAQVKNSDLPDVATEYTARSKDDPVCKIYLLGGNPANLSAWQQEQLEELFTNNGFQVAITEGLKDFEKRGGESIHDEFDDKERERIKKMGFAPYLFVECIVIDDVNRQVVIGADSDIGLLHEHGVAFYKQRGKWRFESGDYLLRYTRDFLEKQEAQKIQDAQKSWRVVFPHPKEDEPIDNNGSMLYGVWRFDPSETAAAFKKIEATKNEINSVLDPANPALREGFYFAEDKMEFLDDGFTTSLERRVARYEHKGHHYKVLVEPADNWDYGFWCDGIRLVSGKKVFMRTDHSYRKGAKAPPLFSWPKKSKSGQ
jgi:hypothetical protein